MKLEENKFYVLDGGSDKWLFTNRIEAIAQMKAIVKSGDGENAKLLSINAQDDEWEITQVPWQEIAFELIKEQG
ncbi:MAG: hypothetical protein KAS63_03155 [Candidatus Heimdallarchaeota archaeon]|nr:hypothetical protein [Candidatus Heimdallarchaeota archaeon]MCK4954335.1 hypothetical protein [Candidatus Heimdallarchaeota archaeon]